MKKYLLAFVLLPVISVAQNEENLKLTYVNAEEIATIPIECLWKEYPNKLNQTLADSSHLQAPAELHPIFYGCFDWHSSIHGHWLLASLMNLYPDTELEKEVISIFDEQFQVPKIQMELAYFLPKVNKSFERTYGWAWYLKLIAELRDSKFNEDHKWEFHMKSLTTMISNLYQEFLPKLVYPIRVGEHNNTAFGLSLAYDYARKVGEVEFETLIIERSKTYYMEDENCPLVWEPSGFDFISPCLQEAELMSKILSPKEFKKWIKDFLPQIFEKDFTLEPGKVSDRTDGKLVHLDGLNFSRAWCLYRLAEMLPKQAEMLISIADDHMKASKDHVLGSDYMGSHWLASFYVKALQARSDLEAN